MKIIVAIFYGWAEGAGSAGGDPLSMIRQKITALVLVARQKNY